MKRIVASLLFAFLALTQPAFAQPQDQSGAQAQALLGQLGQWGVAYQSAIQRAVQPLLTLDPYYSIFDRFDRGELSERQALAAIEQWRAGALEAIAGARADALALPALPSLSEYGPEARALEEAFRAAQDGLQLTFQEIERVVNACADLGIVAIGDPTKSLEVRQQTLLQAQLQLVRVETARLRLVGAGLPADHPSQALMMAMLHYYAALEAVPEHALAIMDGGHDDTAALIASLRQNAADMHREIDRARALTISFRDVVQVQFARQPNMLRIMMQVVDTMPPTIRAYSSLAANLDRAALAMESGEPVLDVWAQAEAWDAPHLNEIARLDMLRARLVASMNGPV